MKELKDLYTYIQMISSQNGAGFFALFNRVFGTSAVNLPNQIKEHIIYSDLGFCRRFHESAVVKRSGKVQALILANDSFILQVALVANQHKGHVITILNPEDLFSEILKIVEGGLCGNTVDEDEPLTVLHVQVAHRGKLFRSGSVEDLQHALLPVHLDLLAVGVLDRRVVLLHEDALDKLDSERRLAHPAAAQHHDLVLPHPRLLVLELLFIC